MILLTGAAGKTGKTILSALVKRGVDVRVLVRNQEQAFLLSQMGAKSEIIGDLRDNASLHQAAKECESIYYICPNVTPDEVQIGMNLISIAKSEKVKRFVYHSVLHPHIESMPHHWQKMRMEECLFESGLDFTILQPCAYMQNILANWQTIIEQNIYSVPYATSARISIVDLEDIAEAAAIVLTDNHRYNNAIFELAGPQPLSQEDVAQVIGKVLNKKISALTLDRKTWSENAIKSKMSEYQIQTLLKMFIYYEKFGLMGNPETLNHLLGRPATSLEIFLQKQSKPEMTKPSGGNN